jgi:DNA modification methylase
MIFMEWEDSVRLIQGDCRDVLKTLPSESVHCVVTSPPYWGLRDYDVDGQIGLEPTLYEWLANIVEVFREVKRVLRSDGTLWLNCGDAYACAPNGRKVVDITDDDRAFRDKPLSTVGGGLKPKDLIGLPWRVAFALQSDAWWLRSDCIWHKPSAMPESVSDRPSRDHEYLFLLAKSGKYFYDQDAIRERTGNEMSKEEYSIALGSRSPAERNADGILRVHAGHGKHDGCRSHPNGRSKRTVWTIPSQPTKDGHYASFPEKLVVPCILASTSERGCCPHCLAPWERVTEESGAYQAHWAPGTQRKQKALSPCRVTGGGVMETGMVKIHTTTGWRPTCHCEYTEDDLVPATILDPFVGSGTVCKVATDLGRRSIGIELSQKYIDKIAKRRTAQRGLQI